jgi:3-(3-hydroxy-phenyl)propionate hydroxylase
MCQGVRDVANLAWKLKAVLHGEVSGVAAESLLDSYGLERKRHVEQLTTRIKGIGAVICERNVAKARERDARMLAECGGVVRDMPRQDVIPGLEGGLLSPVAHAANGTLFPQPWIAQGGDRVRLDALGGKGWWLVLDEGFDGVDIEHAAPRITTLRLGDALQETEGIAAAWLRRHGCRAAIVRPDRYVYGVASTASELAAHLDALAARFTDHSTIQTTETT